MFTVGILICSDKGSRGERIDESGEVIKQAMVKLSASVNRYEIVPAVLKRWADEDKIDLILTSGGTGLSPRDHTPEATLAVIDRQAPGISEAIRAESLRKTPRAMLSRGTAGTRGGCLIINLPGSPIAVQECLDVLMPALPHGIEILTGKASECARDRDH